MFSLCLRILVLVSLAGGSGRVVQEDHGEARTVSAATKRPSILAVLTALLPVSTGFQVHPGLGMVPTPRHPRVRLAGLQPPEASPPSAALGALEPLDRESTVQAVLAEAREEARLEEARLDEARLEDARQEATAFLRESRLSGWTDADAEAALTAIADKYSLTPGEAAVMRSATRGAEAEVPVEKTTSKSWRPQLYETIEPGEEAAPRSAVPSVARPRPKKRRPGRPRKDQARLGPFELDGALEVPALSALEEAKRFFRRAQESVSGQGWTDVEAQEALVSIARKYELTPAQEQMLRAELSSDSGVQPRATGLQSLLPPPFGPYREAPAPARLEGARATPEGVFEALDFVDRRDLVQLEKVAKKSKRTPKKKKAVKPLKETPPKKRRVLAQAEQALLVTRVQRLKALEDIYTGLAVPGESFLDAVNSDGGREAARWAAAAGLPLEDLREQVSVGKQARQRIVEANLGLVYSEVYKLQRKTGRKNVDTGLSYEDLLQEGVFALLRAAEGFDVERKLRFSTYATVAVKRWLQRALQERTRLIRLPAYTYSKYGKIKRVKDKLAWELGAVPPDSEIVEELRRQGMQQKWASEKGVRETLNVVERRPSSLDISVFSGFTDGRSAGVQRKDRISDAGRSGDRVEEEIMVDAVRKDLFAGMALVLNEQEARAIALRFGLDDGEPRSRRMVGDALGISEQAAAALEFRSLRKLRSLLSQKLSATDFGDFLE